MAKLKKKAAAKKRIVKKKPIKKKSPAKKRVAAKKKVIKKPEKVPIGYKITKKDQNIIIRDYEKTLKTFDKTGLILNDLIYDGKPEIVKESCKMITEMTKNLNELKKTINTTNIKPIYK